MHGNRRVLVVDDDDGVRSTIAWALEADGFEVQGFGDGQNALDAVIAAPPSLMILDLSLPGLSGLDLLRQLRRQEDRRGAIPLPVIVVSGRGSETDRIVGLDLGADDYLVKPFSPGELAARARSVLRRSRASPSTDAPFEPIGRGVEIDRQSRYAWVDGVEVELTPKEFDLLAYFLDHPGRALTRAELLAAVWSSQAGWQDEATVTEHVYRLRRKIATDPGQHRGIHTVRAYGYRWQDEP